MTADAEFELKAVGDKQVADALEKISKKLGEVDAAAKKAAGATDALGAASKKTAQSAQQISDTTGKAAVAQGKLGDASKSAALSIGVQVAAIASTSVAIGRAAPAFAQLSQTIAMTAANATALGTVFGPIGIGVAALMAALPSLISYLTEESTEFDALSDSISKSTRSLSDFIAQAARSAVARDQFSRMREGAGTSAEYAGAQAQQRAILSARNRQLVLSMGDANAAAQSAIANANRGNIGQILASQSRAGNLDADRVNATRRAFDAQQDSMGQVALASKRLSDAQTREHNLVIEQQIKETNARDAALHHRAGAEHRASQDRQVDAAREAAAALERQTAFLNAQDAKDREHSDAVLRANRELQDRLQHDREQENEKFQAIADDQLRVSQDAAEQRKAALQQQQEDIGAAGTEATALLLGAFKAAQSEHKALAVAIKDSLDTWLASFAEQELLKAGSLAAEAVGAIFLAPHAVGPLLLAAGQHLAMAAAAGGAAAAIPNGGGRGSSSSARPEDSGGTRSVGSANAATKNVYISINAPIHTEAESGRMVSQLLKAAEREGYHA